MQHRNRASKRKKSTRCSNLKGSWGLHAASGGLWNADAKHACITRPWNHSPSHIFPKTRLSKTVIARTAAASASKLDRREGYVFPPNQVTVLCHP
ncbi:unnamed protein product [Brassica napus]|uniref:(rape) hypothetical protein n=2 Tax=Brassica napus TaxID=3708 RepID=A0A816UKF3_BRANA|nr:unnamed protein product [Brassica napus]